MKLEQRMENVLRKVDIEKPRGKYLQALNRLVKAGIAAKNVDTYTLATRRRII